MARPEKAIGASYGPVAEFARELRKLRRRAGGVSYRELARRAQYSASVLSEAAAGNRLPTLQVTEAYVQACGGDADEWRRRWMAAKAALKRPRAVAEWQKISSERARYPVPESLMAINLENSTVTPGSDSVAPQRPDPHLIQTAHQLVSEMNRLRIWYGNPSLRLLARESGHCFGSSTLGEALNHGNRLPSFQLLVAFVTACGEPPELVEEWRNCWRRIAETLRAGKRPEASFENQH